MGAPSTSSRVAGPDPCRAGSTDQVKVADAVRTKLSVTVTVIGPDDCAVMRPVM